MSTTSLGFATFFTVCAAIIFALSFGTDHWIENKLKPNNLNSSSNSEIQSIVSQILLHPRHSGLFRECFNNIGSAFASKIRSSSYGELFVDGNCLSIEYEIPEKVGHSKYSQDYWAMIHLSRATVAFFIVAMLLLLIGAIFGSVSCWRTTYKPAQLAGIFVFFAAFFGAGAMAFFHGAEYIQKHKLNSDDPPIYYKNWNQMLKKVAVQEYSWSYILGWIGVGVAAIGAAIYIFTAWYINDKKREDELYERYSIHAARSQSRPTVYLDYESQQPVYEVQQPNDPQYVYYVNGKQMVPVQNNGYGGQVVKAGPPSTVETWDYRY